MVHVLVFLLGLGAMIGGWDIPDRDRALALVGGGGCCVGMGLMALAHDLAEWIAGRARP